MVDDAFDALDENAEQGNGDYASWWEPDEGDKIVGVVYEKHSYENQYNGDIEPVWQIRSLGRGDYEEGVEVATPTHAGMVQGLQSADVGDLVQITYEGEEKTDNGFTANNYSIGILTRKQWEDSDQADDIAEVLEQMGSGIQGDNFGDSGNSSSDESSSSSSGDYDSEVTDFAEDIMDMQDGEVELEEFDEFLNNVRDFGVDPEGVADSLGYEVDGDTVKA